MLLIKASISTFDFSFIDDSIEKLIMNIEKVAALIAKHNFKYANEKQLQEGLEELFIQYALPYRREVRLSSSDIVDFVIDGDQRIGIEVKTGGGKNALLRQINRYVTHKEIDSILVIGSPFWVNNLPTELNGKPIYQHRLLTGIF